MRISYRIAILRRAVEQLADLAAERGAQADGTRTASSFRALTKTETEAILGDGLLAALGGALIRD